MTKNNFLNIRVSDSLMDQINQLSTNAQITKSDLIRQILELFVEMKYYQSYQEIDSKLLTAFRKPNMTVNKALIKELFNKIADEDQLRRIAKLDFQFGENHLKAMMKMTDSSKFQFSKRNVLEKFIQSRINLIHGPNGFNWLDDVKLIIRGKSYYISGTHRQGKNFSYYMKYKYELLLGFFDYVIMEESYESRLHPDNDEETWIFKFKFRPLLKSEKTTNIK